MRSTNSPTRRTIKGEDGEPASAPPNKKTVQNVKICLRKAFNDAMGKYLPPNSQNPVVGPTFKYSRAKHRPEMKTWSVEEQRSFLGFTREEREYAGIRPG